MIVGDNINPIGTLIMATGERLRAVELFQAFFWTCDDCGRDNFERGITISPETISLDDLPDTIDPKIQDWREAGGSGLFVQAPTQVKCQHCSATFGTEHADVDVLSD